MAADQPLRMSARRPLSVAVTVTQPRALIGGYVEDDGSDFHNRPYVPAADVEFTVRLRFEDEPYKPVRDDAGRVRAHWLEALDLEMAQRVRLTDEALNEFYEVVRAAAERLVVGDW